MKIAEDVFLLLEVTNCLWSFVPDDYLDKAKALVAAAMDVRKLVRLTSIEGVKVIVLAASAEGLFGAAAVTSGLATLGGGSVAAGGAGLAGGIVVVAAAPSLLSASTLYNLSDALENNTATPTSVALGGTAGALGGTTVGVIMVSEAGAVAGLSASGITSGLAALGGGSVAAGGLGMLGGLAMVAGVATGVTVVAGGAAWLISRAVVQGRLSKQRIEIVDNAVKLGFDILL